MVRPACPGDLPRLLEIYDAARSFMRRNGNPTQWSGGYPGKALLESDIGAGRLYVAEDGDRVWGCFVLMSGPDETYNIIESGSWGQDAPYGALHRVASDGTRKGLVAEAVCFAARQYSYLRIDTHRDNLPMQHAVEKLGFRKRGIIYVSDGTPRIAYDRF